jgi:alpha-tubulin suppressor-like RCC1 family protein
MSTRDIIQAAAGVGGEPPPPPEGSNLYVWGDNLYGELGNNNSLYKISPSQTGDFTSDWATASAGTSFVLAIKTDGTLWSWGSNGSGELGLGDTTARFSPSQVGALTDWVKVYAGSDSNGQHFAAAIKTNNTLWMWGFGGNGRLGQGNTTNYSSPVQVGALSNWAQADVARASTLAVKTDGTLWGWGLNDLGQLGDNTTVSTSSPVQIGALSNWAQVTTGFTKNSHAVKTDGTLWSWGDGATSGVLGLGNTVSYSSPVQVGALSNWAQAAACKITGSNPVSFFIKTDNTIWAVGLPFTGNLGLNNNTAYSSPVQIGALSDWAQVANGAVVNAVVKTDGTLWAWGSGGATASFVGDDTFTRRSSPVQIGSLSDWAQVSCAGGQVNIARRSNGSIYFWGNTASGLGQANSLSPVQVASNEWNSTTFGYRFSFGVKSDNTLWSWGLGNSGQLANNLDALVVSSPTQVGSSTDWSYVAAGNTFAIGLKTNGTLWSWGSNGSGELGLNSTTSYSSPVQVGSDSDWAFVTAAKTGSGTTSKSAMGIKTNGTLWAWGTGNNGQLGIGDTTTYSSPVQVGSLSNWAQVSIGTLCAMAVKTDGTLWAWGNGATGRIPTGLVSYSSPVQIGVDTNWAAVSESGFSGMAVKTNGTLWVWGSNANGELGLGDTTTRSTATQLGALSDWAQISMIGPSSGEAAIAVKTDGTLWSWGRASINGAGGVGLSSPVQVGSLTNWQSPIESGGTAGGALSE